MNKNKIVTAFSAAMLLSSALYAMEEGLDTPGKPQVRIGSSIFFTTPNTKQSIEDEQGRLDSLTASAIKGQSRSEFESKGTMTEAQIARAAKLKEQRLFREKAERESALLLKASAKHQEVVMRNDATKAVQSAKKRMNKSEELLSLLQTSLDERSQEVNNLSLRLEQSKAELNSVTEVKEQKSRELDELRASSGVDLEFIAAQEHELEELSSRYANLLEQCTQAQIQLHTASSQRAQAQSRLLEVTKQHEDRLVSLTTRFNLAGSDESGDEEDEDQEHSDKEEEDDSDIEVGGDINLDADA